MISVTCTRYVLVYIDMLYVHVKIIDLQPGCIHLVFEALLILLVNQKLCHEIPIV